MEVEELLLLPLLRDPMVALPQSMGWAPVAAVAVVACHYRCLLQLLARILSDCRDQHRGRKRTFFALAPLALRSMEQQEPTSGLHFRR